MSIIERIHNANTIVKAILALTILLPSITVFLNLIEIPPSVGNMIYIIGSSVSILTILSIILLSERVERLSNGQLVAYATIAFMIGSLFLTIYLPFANNHVVPFTRENGNAAKALAPMRPTEQIMNMVPQRTYGRPTIAEYTDALQMSPERTELERAMAAASWTTMIIMLLLLVSSEVLILGPVAAMAWKLAGGAASLGSNDAAVASGDGKAAPQDSTQPSPPPDRQP